MSQQHNMEEGAKLLKRDLKTIEEEVAKMREKVMDVQKKVSKEEAVLQSLQEKFRDESEIQSQRRAFAWANFCNTIWINRVEQILEEAKAIDTEFLEVNIAALLKHGESITDLLHLDSYDIVLRWVNYQLEESPKQTKLIQNLGEDLINCDELGVILSRCSHSQEAIDGVHFDETFELEDPHVKIEEVVQRAKALGYTGISEKAIQEGLADINFAFLSYLFCSYPNMVFHERRLDATRDLKKNLLQAYNDWRDLQIKFKTNATSVEPDTIVDCFEKLNHFVGTMYSELDSYHKFHRTYVDLREKVKSQAWTTLIQRSRGTPVTFVDHRAVRERNVYIQKSLEGDWIQSICDTSSLKELEGYLSKIYPSLKAIFKYYSAAQQNGKQAGGAGTIDVDEYWGFVRDCKLPNEKLSLVELQIVFNESKKGYHVLTSNEFVECLIRIANDKYDSDIPLCAKFKKLMEEHVLPRACKSSSQHFRKMMRDPSIVKVFSDYQQQLDTLYKSCAGKDGVINYKEFENFFTKKELIDGRRIKKSDLIEIFQRIQCDADIEKEEASHSVNQTLSKVLSYQEFCEGLVALALMRDPDIFVPASERLFEFLQHDIL
eukprot:g735.t1